MTRSAARTTTGTGAAGNRPGPAHAPRAHATAENHTGPRGRWKVQIAPQPAENAAANETAAPDHLTFDQLRRAAGLVSPLPHRAALERLFGRTLPQMDVRQGPQVDQTLTLAHAEAAIAGLTLFLRQNPDLATVAHEVAHLLLKTGRLGAAPDAALSGTPPQTAEAEALATEGRAMAGRPLAQPAAHLGSGVLAFRDSSAIAEPAQSQADAQQSFRDGARDAPAQDASAGNVTGQTGAPASPAAGGQATPETGANAAAPAAGSPVPTFEPDVMPALEVDTEAADAARQQAEAALSGAEDADQVIAALKDAPPSVKATAAGGLQQRVEQASASEQSQFTEEMPDFQAGLSGTDDLPAPAEVAAPQASAGPLEDGTPAPPPDPVVDPTPDPGTARANQGFSDVIARFFGFGETDGMAETFRHVSTSDDQVETSAGARPEVALEGETDPGRTVEQQTAAAEQAEATRAEAARAVIAGPGPEQLTLRDTVEAFEPPAATLEPLPEAPPVEGPQAFADKGLDAETTALFDAAHGPDMAASLEGAQTEMGTAVADRDTGRDGELAKAEGERDRLNTDANAQQHDEIAARRQEIQDARQTAVDDQAAQVSDLNASAATERATAQGEIDTQVQSTTDQVNASFTTAETEAQAKVDQGNTDAQAERKDAEKEAEDQSWWDRAADWVGRQFDKLTSAINAIFDVVRAAVKGIIDAVKSAALALIDLAAAAIKAAIDAYATLLHGLVDALLATAFPEIAAALNAAIDTVANAAKSAVDSIADTLKAGITALLDALAAGLDAILAAYQAAVNAALALARSALTGDWRALARLILTPILMALGISPEGFFTLMGRAEQALNIIIDSPGVFVTNLIESVKGGIGLFADHFPRHLIAGIIMWLTGPLGAGITMPQQFDLWGILDIARQLVGLTMAMLRRVAVRVIGEKAVAAIEFVMNYVGAAIRNGWQGLWEQLTQDLGQLRDMVLDQIKTFLLEKVVMAAITWLASMFNPIGALVKLVMTIWNFIKFLRTQVARIYPVVELVINNIADIATGALEGPMRGVETILGRMLPVVIDLLMTLLGVVGVPERTQEILKGVQEKVEKATEALMRRVLALFGIKGAEGPTAAPGEIMAPIHFTAGGEAHTISIEDEGETVRPMIQSTPTPLVEWLNQRMGQPFTEYAAEKNWRGAVLNNKRAELQRLVDAAKAEEAALDAKAEETENAINAAAEPNASDAQKAAAAAKSQETGGKGQSTKSAITQILDFFGIVAVDLRAKFEPDIAPLTEGVRSDLNATIFGRLDARLYSTVEWSQAKGMIATERSLPLHWQQPAMRRAGSGGGIIQRADWAGYTATVKDLVKDVANVPDLSKEDDLNQFLDRKITPALNAGGNPAIILNVMLGTGGGAGAAAANACASAIKAAAATEGSEWDHAFAIVTGAYYRDQLVPHLDTMVGQAGWGSYFNDDEENAQGRGTGEPKPMGFFVRPDPAGKSGSKRAAKNGQRLADAVRGGDPGQHEWIASRMASQIVRNAAAAVERGSLEELRGLCELIQFQHRVRTPTVNLVFDPAGPYPEQKVVIAFQAYGHRMSETYRNIPQAQLPKAEAAMWYPPGTPAQGTRIGILQGHPGAIYARVSGGAPDPDIKPQSVGHGRWDAALEAIVARDLADGTVFFNEMHTVGKNILQFYETTVWHGTSMPEGGAAAAAYSEYYNSANAPLPFGSVKTLFETEFTTYRDKLAADLNQVETGA